MRVTELMKIEIVEIETFEKLRDDTVFEFGQVRRTLRILLQFQRNVILLLHSMQLLLTYLAIEIYIGTV